jgi:hypothetical protein
MVEIGIVEIIGMGGALGIIGTMFIVLYFSRPIGAWQGFTIKEVQNNLEGMQYYAKVIRRIKTCV